MLARGLRRSGTAFVMRASTPLVEAPQAGPDAASAQSVQGALSVANPPAARLGLIASRKTARRAVDRNRAKRLAREAFRAARANLPAADVVLQLRNDLRGMGNAAVRAELDALLRALQDMARGGR